MPGWRYRLATDTTSSRFASIIRSLARRSPRSMRRASSRSSAALSSLVRAARRRNWPRPSRASDERSSQASGAPEAGRREVDAGGERDRRGLGARAHAELLEDVCEMELHRVLAERQLGGDVAVAMAHGHQPQDVELAVAERPDERARRLVDPDGALGMQAQATPARCVPQPAADSICSDPPRISARRRIARRPPRSCPLRVEAAAVVDDRDHELVVGHRPGDASARGLRMLARRSARPRG